MGNIQQITFAGMMPKTVAILMAWVSNRFWRWSSALCCLYVVM